MAKGRNRPKKARPDHGKYKNIKIELNKGVARVTLNRPDMRNAFNDELIVEVCDLFKSIRDDDDIRVVVLTGAGRAFCAGADLNWMKRMVHYDRKENIRDAEHLVDMLELMDTCPKPVVGQINGPAIGGGCGVVAVCDIAIASLNAYFAFSEVKLGIIPATISPYVIRKIGIGPTRALFLTGERFDPQRARDLQLVHEVAPPEALDAVVDAKVQLLLTSGPEAMAEVKKLVRMVPQVDPKKLKRYTAELIADLRASSEGQDGMNAFLKKKDPKWVQR